MSRTNMMCNRDKNINRYRLMSRTTMTWKRYRKRKKCTMRTNIMWKKERKTKTKLNRVGRENIKKKLVGTTSP